jgi:superfamily II DNA or RNA helicase
MHPSIKVVGLSATPFTKGLAGVFTNVVNTVTTKDLVDTQMLVPLKIFLAKEIDMTGAKKVAGEWSDAEVTERGIKITGDVVNEWIKKTHEVFGRPRKTIVFCASVAHGASLASKFAESGYNFVPISYLDSDDYKKEVFEDFAKPDTSIHGLIAVDILTKGFDVPDVVIGVSARPFSKSLSSHVQQMGRVMRQHPSKDFALWLDHSGNYLRFQEDWEEIYEQGAGELDDGREKPKKEPTDKTKKEAKCPRCGGLWGNSDICSHCGFVREKRNQVIDKPGELVELEGKMISIVEKQKFYSELIYMVQQRGYKEGWAAWKYKEKFGVFPRNLEKHPVAPSMATLSWLKSRAIAYSKRK